MAQRARQTHPSRAAILGHPIHPMLVPLPIGLLTAALASDVAYAATRDRFWARASRWLLTGGVATGLAAAPFGLTDLLSIDKAREQPDGWVHGIGNAVALAVSTVNLAMRNDDSGDTVVPTGLALSAAVGGLLAITGWYGGELSYRHGVGVLSGEDAPADAAGG